MKIRLERIDSDERRATKELKRGEIVKHDVMVSVNGHQRPFSVFVKANVLPTMDASLVYGDELLEELLRFEPAALNMLYSVVGQYRRGIRQPLPIVLLDTTEQGSIIGGLLSEAPSERG